MKENTTTKGDTLIGAVALTAYYAGILAMAAFAVLAIQDIWRYAPSGERTFALILIAIWLATKAAPRVALWYVDRGK